MFCITFLRRLTPRPPFVQVKTNLHNVPPAFPPPVQVQVEASKGSGGSKAYMETYGGKFSSFSNFVLAIYDRL